MHRRLTAILVLALTCPGHAEPTRRPAPAAAAVPVSAPVLVPNLSVDDLRMLDAKSRKAIVANGGGRLRVPNPDKSYATVITHMKEPHA